MARNRVTIKDLANALNFSPSTVSRALANHPDISKATKEKVREAVKTFGYIPNLQAKYLRTNSSGTIALILPEINMFFTPALMNGVNKIVEQKEYSLIILQTYNSTAREKKQIEFCRKLSVDGVLLCVSDETKDLTHLSLGHKNDLPIVLLDKVVAGSKYPSISIDGADASFLATRYLLKKGHKEIIGIFGNSNLQMTQLRKSGFIRAFQSSTSHITPEQLVSIDKIENFGEQFQEVLDKYPKTTALFVMSDELLVKVHHHLVKKGFRIPKDMALISISDGQAPYYLHPTITHVLHSGYEVGMQAANHLFHLMDSSYAAPVAEKIKTKLVELNSV